MNDLNHEMGPKKAIQMVQQDGRNYRGADFENKYQSLSFSKIINRRGLSYFYSYNILTCIVPFEFYGFNHFHSLDDSVLHYDMQNLEIPTVPVLGSLVKSGIRVLVYR